MFLGGGEGGEPAMVLQPVHSFDHQQGVACGNSMLRCTSSNTDDRVPKQYTIHSETHVTTWA